MKPARRLLLVTTVAATPRAFLTPVGRRFRDRGWRVDVACADAGSLGDLLGDAFDNTLEVGLRRTPAAVGNVFAGIQMRRLVASGAYHIVHVHTPVAAFVTRVAIATRQTSAAVVYTAHGFHFHDAGSLVSNEAYLLAERIASRWTDYLVVINRDDHRAALKHHLIRPRRLSYIPGVGVDLSWYSPNAVTDAAVAAVRSSLRLSPSDVLFTCVAEFSAGKRHGDIVRALAHLGDSRVHVAFAGDGPELAAIGRLANSMGVGAQIHFLGFVDDVRPLIRASRCVLLVSNREGLPRSVMESLSLAVPTIVTNVRGSRDLAVGCGLTVGLGDMIGLSRSLARMIQYPREAAAMGAEGRLRMKTYDVERVLALHEDLYEAAISRADRPESLA